MKRECTRRWWCLGIADSRADSLTSSRNCQSIFACAKQGCRLLTELSGASPCRYVVRVLRYGSTRLAEFKRIPSLCCRFIGSALGCTVKHYVLKTLPCSCARVTHAINDMGCLLV